ncbi:MAG: hypothetical protein DDT37_00265 [Firmicutes bacterium]|nr:hypothetical protein [candidate division NPL-UPA2 bacterium]
MKTQIHEGSIHVKWDRAFIILAVTGLCFNLALGVQNTMHMNFVTAEIGLAPENIGALDGIREIPGLLTAALALAALLFTNSSLASLCLVLVGIGTIVYGQADTFTVLVIGTLIHSVGFHLFAPLQQSMVLSTSPADERGKRLGIMTSIAAFATVLASLLVNFLTPQIQMRNTLLVAAVFAFVGSLVQLISRKGERADIRKGMVFKWQYKSYYGLTLLAGSRRQINFTFARMLLVIAFGVPVTAMAALMLVGNLLSIVTRPLFGRIIDRFGERKVLIINYALLIGIFASYAWVDSLIVLYALFVLDHLLLGFDIAITTHLDSIAPRSDIAPSLAMGSTINHITGVIVPVGGGILWSIAGPQSVFLIGAVICALSLLQARTLPARGEVMHCES